MHATLRARYKSRAGARQTQCARVLQTAYTHTMADSCWRRYTVFLALLLVSSAGAGDGCEQEGWVVRTETGAVRGIVRSADYGEPYLSFRGIPYARPPLGHLRYKSPQRAHAWTGVREAHQEGPVCPQHDVLYGRLMRPHGFSEDCLTVNVHVPLNVPSEDIPVLVFLHGGGFGFGSGDSDLYGPEYLVAKGVIVVTINYRLGALGFLSLDTDELPANLGLRDMIAGLSWVQRNIAAFGGDPHNVTLGGQSAGAVAAHLLTLAPAARGLFSRCILMSGMAMRSWFSMSPSNAKRLTKNFLSKLNITGADDKTLLRELRRVPVERIVEVTSEMQNTEGINVFVPVVEKGSSEPIVVGDPYMETVGGKLIDVPMLIGYTNFECETFAPRFRKLNFGHILKMMPVAAIPPSLLHASSDAQNAQHVIDIKKYYLNDNTSEPERVLQQFLEYCTDAYFKYPTIEFAQVVSRRNTAPVFLYEFAYDGHYSPIKSVVSGGFRGAGHIEDMTYLLRTNSFPANISSNALDQMTKEWMTLMFSNFIKTGSPNPASVGDETVEWAPYEADGDELSLRLDGGGAQLQSRANSHLLPFFRHLYSNSFAPYNSTAKINKTTA